MRGTGTTYNHLWRYALVVTIVGALLGAVSFWPSAPTGEASVITIGVDTEIGGNSASSLGPRESCRTVSVNETFDVDLFITNVPSLQHWELRLGYDPSRLSVLASDMNFMIPSFALAEDESNGSYFFGAGGTPVVSGSGVLVRVTLQALAPGLTPLSVRNNWPFTPILSYESTHPGDTNGDSYFDGPILNAQIAVGQSCTGVTPPPTQTQPATPTPSPSPLPTATAAPTPTGTVGGVTDTPTFTPVPGTIPWGDIDCSNSVTIDDAKYIAMIKAGFDVTPVNTPCPHIGDEVFGAVIDVNWGDFDCSGQFDLGDVIHLMRYLIGLTGGVGGCPLVATNYVSFP